MLAYLLTESSTYLDFTALYTDLDLQVSRFPTTRKLNKAMTKNPPALLIAEFEYGYGSNYAGINISNLDVSLHTLRRYAPDAKVIIMCYPHEKQYVKELEALFPLHHVLCHPVHEADLSKGIKLVLT